MNPNLDNYKDILLGLCNQLNINNLIEIGLGWNGLTTDYILTNYKKEDFVYYIIENDLHPRAIETLSKHDSKRYKICTGHSHDESVYKEIPKVDCFLVDGDHSFDGIYGDIKICYELDLLNECGYIVFHDTNSEQIKQALYTSIKDFGLEYLNFENANFAIGKFREKFKKFYNY